MKNQLSIFDRLADQQKTQFFVTVRSRNHVGDKWKKIIQYGKKSWTNKPFHQSVPSHSTTLLLPEGFYWSNIYIGTIKVSIRRNNKNVEIYRSKALEYKVGPNRLLFTWYTLSIRSFLRGQNCKFWYWPNRWRSYFCIFEDKSDIWNRLMNQIKEERLTMI